MSKILISLMWVLIHDEKVLLPEKIAVVQQFFVYNLPQNTGLFQKLAYLYKNDPYYF